MSNDRIKRIPAPVIPGISDSVRVSAGDLIFISGAVGFEEDGTVPADFSRAVEKTFRELERALAADGASFSNVARINVYITDLSQERLNIFREVRDSIIDTTNVPASSVIGVSALFKGAEVEIDAIAAV